MLYFRIDRKKKILVSTLLLALGYTKKDIVNEFYDKETYLFNESEENGKQKFDPENYKV